jgi:hypothetical protein
VLAGRPPRGVDEGQVSSHAAADAVEKAPPANGEAPLKTTVPPECVVSGK